VKAEELKISEPNPTKKRKTSKNSDPKVIEVKSVEIKVEEVKIAEPKPAKSKKNQINILDIIKTTVSSGPEKILDRSFYKQNILDLSRSLLGKIVVRKTAEGIVKCRIVETEAYCGITDRACHAYQGKKTDKTKWMFAEGGHVYIFSIYGHNFCLNITSGEEGDPSAVLVRATEPVENLELIKKLRKLPKVSGTGKELTNGPGKLCMAMNIDKSSNGHDLTKGEELYLIDDGAQVEVDVSARINIDYAGEDVDKPWRYTIKNNVFVSVK